MSATASLLPAATSQFLPVYLEKEGRAREFPGPTAGRHALSTRRVSPSLVPDRPCSLSGPASEPAGKQFERAASAGTKSGACGSCAWGSPKACRTGGLDSGDVAGAPDPIPRKGVPTSARNAAGCGIGKVGTNLRRAPRFRTFSDSLYARARLNGNLELSRRINIVGHSRRAEITTLHEASWMRPRVPPTPPR
jgi:hypothetical protein